MQKGILIPDTIKIERIIRENMTTRKWKTSSLHTFYQNGKSLKKSDKTNNIL
jgi:hypothetical protein